MEENLCDCIICDITFLYFISIAYIEHKVLEKDKIYQVKTTLDVPPISLISHIQNFVETPRSCPRSCRTPRKSC